MTALEALALARAAGVSVSLADDGAHIRYRSRGKAPVHVIAALKAAKPEIYAKREREHIRSFRAQMASGGYRGLRFRLQRPKHLGYEFTPTRRACGRQWWRKPSSAW
jgi:hypothetical protein